MIEAKIVSINGQAAAGFYRLTLGVEVTLQPYQQGEVTLVRYDGELMVKGKGGGAFPVGRLVPGSAPHRLTADGRREHTNIYLGIELDERRLKAIEDIRLGGDLTLVMTLWCLVSDRTGLHCHDSTGPAEYEVNQSAWIKAREQMGVGRTILLEIPVPDPDEAPELARAVGLWHEARQEYLRGDDRDAVGKCRLALEALSKGVGDPDDKKIEVIYKKEVEALFDGVRMMDKTERFRLLRRALKVVSGIALHEKGVGSEITWERGDAFAFVTMCGALLLRSIEQR